MQSRPLAIFILLIFSASLANAQILLDEDFSDWQGNALYSDPVGDDGSSNIDFSGFWMSHDEDFLYFRIQVGKVINLQDNNNITLYLDTDNDASTGLSVQDLGAEVVYNFGDRDCTIRIGNEVLDVNHSEVSMVSSPTFTSDEFEFALSRALNFLGQDLYAGNTVRLIFRDESLGGDDMPNSGSISYQTDAGNNDWPSYTIPVTEPDFLRMLSYNVQFDGFFESAKKPSFERILQAIQPDIIGFQEIYDHSAAQTAQLVEEYLPSGAGEEWFYAKEGPDIIAVSRYPIDASFVIEGGSSGGAGNGAFLLDLRPEFDTRLLMIVAHTPCCDDNYNRQQEIDAIMGFVRDAKSGEGPLQIAQNTPIVIMGDMNMVGDNQQLETLLTGDIVFQNPYGPDFLPDWDGSDLDDAKPFTTGLPMSLTWYDSGSSFNPGRLDFMIYSGASLELRNTYALFTPTLLASELNTLGLDFDDVLVAADHLPVVADFEILVETAVEEEVLTRKALLQTWPNPASDTLNVRYELASGGEVRLEVVDLQGRQVKTETFYQASGTYVRSIGLSDLPAGNYFVRLLSPTGKQVAEVVVSR
ncbi:MAG: T9SS type A sorting domain-containing protein [Bacteroidetes bacterium]|nr:T9SS type A sorting domain-containing protein [Bacteroidota bacterium]